MVERSKLRAANLAGRDRTGLTWDSVLWREAHCTASFVHSIHNCTYLSATLFPTATRSQVHVTMCQDSEWGQILWARSHFCLFSLGLGNLKHYLQLLSYHVNTYVNKPYGSAHLPSRRESWGWIRRQLEQNGNRDCEDWDETWSWAVRFSSSNTEHTCNFMPNFIR